MKVHELSHAITTSAAIFGRNENVTVVFEGSQAQTDGNVIILPAMPLNADISEDTAQVIRGYIDHEAGHIRHTDFDVVNSIKDESLMKIWNSIEDIWLERRVREEYIGSEKNLRATAEFVSGKEMEFLSKNKELLEKVNAETISLAICKQGRMDYTADNNKTVFDMLPDNMKKWSEKWVSSIDKCYNSTDNLALASAIRKLVEEDPKLESDPENFKFDPEGYNPADEKAEGETKTEGKGEGKGEGEAEGMPKAEDLLSELLNKGGTYEYNGSRKKGYRSLTTRYDKTYTRTTPLSDNGLHQVMLRKTVGDYQLLVNDIGPVVNVMRSKLRRGLLSKENRDWDFGRQQGRLDSKRLTAAYSGAESVYKVRKDREEFDTAVHFLVDLSGSMHSSGKILTATYTAIAMAECLEGTGIKYQISGFSNNLSYSGFDYSLASAAEYSGKEYHRFEPLQTYVFKGFNDSLAISKGSMVALKDAAGGNNSDAEALMWAHKVLAVQPQKRKILFVLSDGAPANKTINCGRYEGEEVLETALKDVVKSISKKVECVGLGICTDTVQNFYDDYIVIDKVEDLAGAAFNKLSKILIDGKIKL